MRAKTSASGGTTSQEGTVTLGKVASEVGNATMMGSSDSGQEGQVEGQRISSVTTSWRVHRHKADRARE